MVKVGPKKVSKKERKKEGVKEGKKKKGDVLWRFREERGRR